MLNLSTLGFDEKETAVYIALLELGEVTVSAIVRKSNIKRTTVYAIIETLERRGLIGYTKHNKRTFYFAEDPRLLSDQLEEKKERLNAVLPQLLALSGRFTKKPKIRYYEGKEGIEHVYKDTLLYQNQELVGWVTSRAIHAFDSDFLYNQYLPKRLEKKIWVRAIAPDTLEMRKYKNEDKQSLRTTRLVSGELFPFDVEVCLYGTRNIAIMSFEEQFGMIIESEKLWHTLKSMFEMGWKFAEMNHREQ